MKTIDELIDEFFTLFEGKPSVNSIVRNNTRNDAFELVVLKILYGKILDLQFDIEHIDELAKYIIAPPDEKIDIFTRFNMIIAIPCAAGFIVLAKPLLDLLFFTENNTLGGVLLQMGAISVVFYNLSTVTNAVLQGLDNMMVPVKSAAISLVIHIISLFLMMVVFKWGIYAVVLSKIVFSLSTCILNAHALRERIGYVQEQKKTFVIPAIASIIMGIVTLVVHLLFELFVGTRIATVIALCVAVAVYGVALVLLGGVTEKELSSMPKGPMLVKICKKAHLFRS